MYGNIARLAKCNKSTFPISLRGSALGISMQIFKLERGSAKKFTDCASYSQTKQRFDVAIEG
jgi:hypothetical protein